MRKGIGSGFGDGRRRHSGVHMGRILHVEMPVASRLLVHEEQCEGKTRVSFVISTAKQLGMEEDTRQRKEEEERGKEGLFFSPEQEHHEEYVLRDQASQ